MRVSKEAEPVANFKLAEGMSWRTTRAKSFSVTPDPAADIEGVVLEFFGNAGQVNAQRGVLVIYEVVLLSPPLGSVKGLP